MAKRIGSPQTIYSGQIDNVKIFNYARSAAQVAWDYNKGGPVGYWRMDDCQGTSVVDSSGNANTGTITVGASGTYTSVGNCNTSSASSMWFNGLTGKRNYSLAFDGTDDYVSLGAGSTLNITGPITVSAWVKGGSFGAANAVVARGTGAGSTTQYLLTVESGIPRFYISNGAAIFFATGGTTLTTGTWYHLTATFDATTLKIYTNGVIGTNATFSGTQTTYSTNPPSIGAYSTGTFPFNGQIDDVRIYNYALTAGQVKLLYNNGAINFGPLTGSP
jgi:hypothetical protein